MSELRHLSGDAAGDSPIREPRAIQARLQPLGVIFAQYPLTGPAPDVDAGQDEVIEAQCTLLDTIMREHGLSGIDVLNLDPSRVDPTRLQAESESEHWHPDAEARLFLAGGGRFHLRSNEYRYELRCVPGDYVGLPAGLRHAFLMDSAEHLCMVRLRASDDAGETIAASVGG